MSPCTTSTETAISSRIAGCRSPTELGCGSTTATRAPGLRSSCTRAARGTGRCGTEPATPPACMASGSWSWTTAAGAGAAVWRISPGMRAGSTRTTSSRSPTLPGSSGSHSPGTRWARRSATGWQRPTRTGSRRWSRSAAPPTHPGSPTTRLRSWPCSRPRACRPSPLASRRRRGSPSRHGFGVTSTRPTPASSPCRSGVGRGRRHHLGRAGPHRVPDGARRRVRGGAARLARADGSGDPERRHDRAAAGARARRRVPRLGGGAPRRAPRSRRESRRRPSVDFPR